MPQITNPWLQLAGVGGGAADDLGRLMLQIPAARADAAQRQQELGIQKQQAAMNMQNARNQQQLFPYQLEQAKAKNALMGEQGNLLNARAAAMDEQSNLYNQKSQQLQQQLQAVDALLKSHPEFAAALYGKQPLMRQGGGMTYNAMTGQPVATGPRVLNPGQSMTGAGMVGGAAPGLIAQSPFGPQEKNNNGNVIAAVVNSYLNKGNPGGLDTNAMNGLLSNIVSGGFNRPIRGNDNSIPQTGQQSAQTNSPLTNSVKKRWTVDAQGNAVPLN